MGKKGQLDEYDGYRKKGDTIHGACVAKYSYWIYMILSAIYLVHLFLSLSLSFPFRTEESRKRTKPYKTNSHSIWNNKPIRMHKMWREKLAI